VLGLDPGFANLGWCVAELHPEGGPRALSVGVFCTEKAAKKANLYASHDDIRRSREIAGALAEIINGFSISALCAESMSFPRSSSVAAKMALSWGVIAAHADRFRLPIVALSPQSIKLAVARNKAASKDDVAKGVRGRMSGIDIELRHVIPSKREHPFDAAASIIAAQDSDVIRSMQQAYRA